MLKRIQILALCGLVALIGCTTNKKVTNPIANVDSKQPDKVLFDRAMDALKHNHYDVARLTLQTLINTYPDSEYIARAKLAVADSWYAEGNSASLSEAEIQYKDFETFFPNMPEAAEAQMKIANIHYQQMEKPDRDYTHAMRAEAEYRELIQQYPDSKLVPQAKQRLREVQEVIAEREFEVGRFYYMRQSYPAAIARLESLADQYPLYSKADEVLYLLGQSYEAEINVLRNRPTCSGTPPRPMGCMLEAPKAAMIKDFTKHAADAYDRVVTRYPLMDRAPDAKARLLALHEPVPRPTKAAVAENKAEDAGRKSPNTLTKIFQPFEKHPTVEEQEAAHNGEPTLVDPTPVSASDVVKEANKAAIGAGDNHSVSVETVGNGAPPPGEAAPRSDTVAAPADTGGVPAAAPANPTTENPANASPLAADPNELKPNVPTDANELKPNVPEENPQALPPPQQVNQLGQDAANSKTESSSAQTGQAGGDTAQNSADDQTASDADTASSKKKKKTGIHKVIPF
ncbi:MAG TPA: outer membrane protein assembly factor BamD [Terriglobales bacterium]